jgi:DNA-binding NtrC family response regulator
VRAAAIPAETCPGLGRTAQLWPTPRVGLSEFRAAVVFTEPVNRVLYVLAPSGVRTHELPNEGQLVLGRADDCDVPLADPSVSRQHARLHVHADQIQIEDLESANGTRVRRTSATNETHDVSELRIEPFQKVLVRLDEPIMVGSVTVIVRNGEARPQKTRAAPLQEPTDEVVAVSAETARIFEFAARIAKGPLNVLITGETGVGKEVLARHVHTASPRASGPFVEVNAATLTETLAESELFGHEKGAFTGAVSQKKGFFEAADGGTLFLDEVGELPASLQAKLLRVLEAKKVTRVGGTQTIAVDVRVLAATHRDLSADVAAGRFRQDLYFRLNGITLKVTPLRERKEDVPELARRFALRTAQVMGLPAPTFTKDALDKLSRHSFPGNVRELRNVVDRAVAISAGSQIDPSSILFDESPSPSPSVQPPASDGEAEGLDFRARKAADEKKAILAALESADGNQTRAAELLGMPRRTLVARLSEYGLTKPRKK